MTKTRLGVEGEIDGRIPQLRRLMRAAWRQGVHFAWTVDGELVGGGPDTPAARAAVDALQPHWDLLCQAGLLALAENGVPAMESVEAALDYVRHALARDRAGGLPSFLEMLGIGPEQ